MAKTELRNDAKKQILKTLREEGYPSYARLAQYFDIYLTDDPDVIGYMVPGKAKIVLNASLNIDQVSTIIRHEILHEYLTHGERGAAFEKNLGKGNPKLSNIAADYEISNKGYTQKDKSIARRIKLGDNVLRGLVTEDEHPEWMYLSYEEMYQKLLDQMEKDEDSLKDLLDQLDKVSGKNIEDLEDQIEDAESQAADADDTDTQAKLSKLKDKLDDAKSDLNAPDQDDNDQPIDSVADQRDKAEVAERVKQIADLLKDVKAKQSVMDDAAQAIRKEKAAKAAQEAERINSSGIQQFKLNLNRFIANQIEEDQFDSYARVHPSYEDSEFILPGKLTKEEKHIPKINVYWDVSGSFDDPAKTASARQAIGTLNQYVRDGDIVIDVFYFADRVSDTRESAGWGTRGTPIQNHIDQTKPDNVIIVTDGDISDCHSVTEVPGAVWMLFYDTRSQNLMDHIHGKRQNKYYDIKYK